MIETRSAGMGKIRTGAENSRLLAALGEVLR